MDSWLLVATGAGLLFQSTRPNRRGIAVRRLALAWKLYVSTIALQGVAVWGANDRNAAVFLGGLPYLVLAASIFILSLGILEGQDPS